MSTPSETQPEVTERLGHRECVPADATRVHVPPPPPDLETPLSPFDLFGIEVAALQARPWKELHELVRDGKELSAADESFYAHAREYVARLSTTYPLLQVEERIQEAIDGIEGILTRYAGVLPEEVREELRRVKARLIETGTTGST